MINHVGWREDDVVMTIFANIAGLDMRGILAYRIVTVVAAETVVAYVGVIKCRRSPASRRMTVITRVAAAYVGRMFARSSRAIVTG